MTGLKPSGVARLAIEVKAAVPTHAAVVGSGACKWRLWRPSESALLGGKERKLQDDLVDRKKALRGSSRARGTLMIRSCMVIGHGQTRRGEILLVSFQPAALIVKRQRTECRGSRVGKLTVTKSVSDGPALR
jgi:hypothetical protein